MINTEIRWSLWYGNYLYYWVDNRCKLFISLRTCNVFLPANRVKLTNEEVNNIIPDTETKEILLDLFNKKFPNGKFEQNGIPVNISDGEIYFIGNQCWIKEKKLKLGMINDACFLDLETGEWAANK